MEALASDSSWIPADDLLLKNSIEAGASLEALAKGAVNFSRKFSVRELQERWHSLLYDPGISAEVSARMTEYELSIPNQLLRSNTSGKSKENFEASRKRKFGSIRSLYYALRKKICRECDISTDLSCISTSIVHDGISNIGDDPQGVISNNDPPVGSHMLIYPVASQLQLPEASSDITHRPLPQISRDPVANVLNDTAKANPSVQDNSENGEFRKDGLLEFQEAISAQPLPAHERNERICKHSFDEINTQKEFNCMNEEKLAEIGNLGIEELRHSHTGQHQSLSKTALEAIPPLAFGSMNANVENATCGYGRTEQIDSHASDDMPLWKTIEDVSALATPNASIEDKVQDVEGSLRPSGQDNDSKNLSGDSRVHPRSMLEDTHNDVLEGTMAMPQGDFVGLPDSLLKIENSEELNVGLNDKVNESSLDNCNSRLLCSKEVHEVEIPSFSEHATSVSPVDNTCFDVPGGACPVEREYPAGASHPISSNQNRSSQSEANVAQISLMPMTHSSELQECMLNSEDPDIPDNDDISFLTAVAMPFSFLKSNSKEASEHPQSYMNKREHPNQYLRASNPFSDIDREFKHSNIGLGVVSKCTDNGKVPSNCRKAQPTLDCPRNGGLEITKFNFEKMNATATFRENQLFHAEQTSVSKTFTEQGMTRDQEEYESDDDIPYFSDIEAMILDMDLGPCEPDPGISEKVSRYQTDDAKRRIMRLEQSAHSCLIRRITSQGAFAILYGHHLKHYIKKTEAESDDSDPWLGFREPYKEQVILGRATNDFDVDIDLGREGRANKISRRQAIITLKENGSFLLKNLGKNSIFVNGNEVSTGQLLVLTSSCLIEIRDLSFVFEVNHKFVRQHIANLHKKCPPKNIKFEWMPEGGP